MGAGEPRQLRLNCGAVTTEFPVFERPPVEEVAVALYFSPALRLSTATLGTLWQRWRSRFARSEDQPPLPPVQPLNFGDGGPSFSIQVSVPTPRVWFLSQSGNEVLQVQGDRLVRNWRRMLPDDPYPHYDQILPKFREDIEQFFGVLSEEDIPQPKIQQCEVTYINPIPADLSAHGGDLSRILSPWSGEMSDSFLGRPDSVQVQLSYRFPTSESPQGILNVSFGDALRSSPEGIKPVYLLQLSARGIPVAPDLAASFELLDLEHEWIVKGFASLTAPEMHSTWEKR